MGEGEFLRPALRTCAGLAGGTRSGPGDIACRGEEVQRRLRGDRARVELGDARSIPIGLDGLAWVACAEGHVERAAHLLGAEEALRERVGAIVPPLVRADHDRAVAEVRAALNETELASLWQEGRAMSLAEAIRYALDEPAKLDA